jgi:hypothetical protein
MGEWSYNSMILDLDNRSRWSGSCRGRSGTREEAVGTYRIGGYGWPRDGLEVVEKKIFLAQAGNPTPAVQSVATRYTD